MVTKALPQDMACLTFVAFLRRRAYPLGSFELLLRFCFALQRNAKPTVALAAFTPLFQVKSSKTKREIADCNLSFLINYLIMSKHNIKLPGLPIRERIVLRCM
ncbi:MAG TPA: hypothetical protein VIG43_00510, partial [Kurthia sp.]